MTHNEGLPEGTDHVFTDEDVEEELDDEEAEECWDAEGEETEETHGSEVEDHYEIVDVLDKDHWERLHDLIEAKENYDETFYDD